MEPDPNRPHIRFDENFEMEPGKLISYRQARRTNGSIFYGFPLDEDGAKQCGNKLAPIDPDLTGMQLRRALIDQMPLIFRRVRTICDPVWPSDKTHVEVGWTGREQHSLLALVACTRRNDQLIPPAEVMQELKHIMAEEGFKEEPRWFVVWT